MFKLEDLNPHAYPTDAGQQANLGMLLEKLNKLIAAGCPIKRITSGLRTEADQNRINPKAPHSKHLLGAAADVEDASGVVKQWVTDNMDKLVGAGLYCESFLATPTWCHFQCIAPASGHRIFLP